MRKYRRTGRSAFRLPVWRAAVSAGQKAAVCLDDRAGGRRSRRFLGFLLVGIGICFIAAEVNTLLVRLFDGDMIYVTTNITPVTEEVLKSLPVFVFAWTLSDDRKTLVSIAFATGLGFALLENLLILIQNIDAVSVAWAFARGISAALMHSVCTSLTGMGISYIKKRRKLFYCGTFSLMTAVVIYHAIFNSLVQSQYCILGFILPTLVCVPLFSSFRRETRQSAE